jgi:hypothetical protein
MTPNSETVAKIKTAVSYVASQQFGVNVLTLHGPAVTAVDFYPKRFLFVVLIIFIL